MKACHRCKKEGELKKCASCKSVWYCSKECQKEDWKAHKPMCPILGAQTRSEASGNGSKAGFADLPNPAAWCAGLGAAEAREWLVDCYRMRVDDDNQWGGGNRHGLYHSNATSDSVLHDFLVFCKLAARNGVVPAGWEWKAFLGKAVTLLGFAFEKADAKEKYGGENIFKALMGGRSLRATGEAVYQSSCMGGDGTSAQQKALEAEVKQKGPGKLDMGRLLEEKKEVFAEVGGADIWAAARSKLKVPGVWG